MKQLYIDNALASKLIIEQYLKNPLTLKFLSMPMNHFLYVIGMTIIFRENF